MEWFVERISSGPRTRAFRPLHFCGRQAARLPSIDIW
jgi:hypothetical protein